MIPPQGGRKHPQQEMIPVDTTNILFICGGAFGGLSSLIKERLQKKHLGFVGNPEEDQKLTTDQALAAVEPQDMVKYGLIPELVGRLPVITSLANLSEKDLIRVLCEPQNSLVKQYTSLFRYDGAELKITDGALRAIAQKALVRKSGARGLRSILETVLMECMYKLPRLRRCRFSNGRCRLDKRPLGA